MTGIEQEKPDLSEQCKYDQFFEWAKKELLQLYERLDINVKSIIIELAKKLETAGMPSWMICSEISRQLKGYCPSRYIRDCLDNKYKDESKVREQSTSHLLLISADDGKKAIEIISDGIEDVAAGRNKLDADVEDDDKKVMETLGRNTTTTAEEDEESKKYEERIKKAAAINDKILAENQTLGQQIEELQKQNLPTDIRNEELKTQLQRELQKHQQQHRHHHHKHTSALEELKQLTQEELIKRVQELSEALEQTRPFQTAAEIATSAASGSENEVIIPGGLFKTIFLILSHGEDNCIYLTIRGNEVIGLKGHNQRVKREKEDIVK